MIIDNMTQEWKVDVPVAINFFARPDTFELAFAEIKKAKPRQLFLIADGPRPGLLSHAVSSIVPSAV